MYCICVAVCVSFLDPSLWLLIGWGDLYCTAWDHICLSQEVVLGGAGGHMCTTWLNTQQTYLELVDLLNIYYMFQSGHICTIQE